MAWYNNPTFGVSHGYDNDEQEPSRPSFGFQESRNKGDGKWCEACLREGIYSWLDFKGIYGKEDVYKLCVRVISHKIKGENNAKL